LCERFGGGHVYGAEHGGGGGFEEITAIVHVNSIGNRKIFTLKRVGSKLFLESWQLYQVKQLRSVPIW
jgi:hypothetical protein